MNSSELSNLLRIMAEDHGPEYSTAYWQGWSDAIGSHLSTLTSAADKIDELEEAMSIYYHEAESLRALIIEWADIEDGYGRPVLDEYTNWKLVRKASDALRRAVGR